MTYELCEDAGVLIVDDQVQNVRLLERILSQAGFTRLHSVTDGRLVFDLFSELEPDIILLDLHMPHIDGFTVLQQLQSIIAPQQYFPVLVLSADITPASKRRALELGAKDFLSKPFDAVEVVLRIKNLLETRRLYAQLQRQNQDLESKVQERTVALDAAQIETLERLARAAEYRDDDTGLHTHRVGRMAALLAAHLDLPMPDVERLRRAAPLHDVGKIGIPDHILLKPSRLSPDEFDVIKTHTTIGAGILAGSQSERLQLAEEIAITHHERWDGTGYPRGLGGTEIPIAGRIVAVADVYDALTHERPYKHAWTKEEAIAEIERQSGRQFDPQVVTALLYMMEQ